MPSKMRSATRRGMTEFTMFPKLPTELGLKIVRLLYNFLDSSIDSFEQWEPRFLNLITNLYSPARKRPSGTPRESSPRIRYPSQSFSRSVRKVERKLCVIICLPYLSPMERPTLMTDRYIRYASTRLGISLSSTLEL